MKKYNFNNIDTDTLYDIRQLIDIVNGYILLKENKIDIDIYLEGALSYEYYSSCSDFNYNTFEEIIEMIFKNFKGYEFDFNEFNESQIYKNKLYKLDNIMEFIELKRKYERMYDSYGDYEENNIEIGILSFDLLTEYISIFKTYIECGIDEGIRYANISLDTNAIDLSEYHTINGAYVCNSALVITIGSFYYTFSEFISNILKFKSHITGFFDKYNNNVSVIMKNKKKEFNLINELYVKKVNNNPMIICLIKNYYFKYEKINKDSETKVIVKIKRNIKRRRI